MGAFTDTDKQTVTDASQTWSNVLTNAFPSGTPLNGNKININVLKLADDHPALASAAVTAVNATNGKDFGEFFPTDGQMNIKSTSSNPITYKTVLHEIGHILGIGTFWNLENLKTLLNDNTIDDYTDLNIPITQTSIIANKSSLVNNWDDSKLQFSIFSNSSLTTSASLDSLSNSDTIHIYTTESNLKK